MSLKKFRKCQFEAKNENHFRKNKKMFSKGILIISGLLCVQNVFFRKSPFLFRSAFHFRKNIFRQMLVDEVVVYFIALIFFRMWFQKMDICENFGYNMLSD